MSFLHFFGAQRPRAVNRGSKYLAGKAVILAFVVTAISTLEAQEPLSSFRVTLEQPPLAKLASSHYTKTGQMPDVMTMDRWRSQIQQQHSEFISQLPPYFRATKQLMNTSNTVIVEFYSEGDSALNLDIKKSGLKTIKALPHVKSVGPTGSTEALIERSRPVISASEPQLIVNDQQYNGSGVSIGVLDTGIQYNHLSFGGNGDPDANSDFDTLSDFAIPNPSKIIGGYDFVDSDSDFAENDESTGHGTGVSAIAAGLQVQRNDEEYIYPDHGKGIAWGAQLYGLRVLGSDGSGSNVNIEEGIDWSLDPNQNGSFEDAIDIINLSLGGRPYITSRLAEGLQNAARLGVLPILAAGNDGKNFYSVTTQVNIDNSLAISVAGSNVTRTISSSLTTSDNTPVTLNIAPIGPETIHNYSINEEEGTEIRTEADNPLSDKSLPVYLEDSDADNCRLDYDFEKIEGHVVFVDGSLFTKNDPIDGVRNRVCKIDDLMTGFYFNGASAVVIFGLKKFPTLSPVTPNEYLPLILLAPPEITWDAIKNTSIINNEVTLHFSNIQTKETISETSSMGPSFGKNTFAPSITAPGQHILTATSKNEYGMLNESKSITGTSFAAPIVSGAAAVLKQRHPNLPSNAIKALLMNYAEPLTNISGEPYSTTMQGAGRVNLEHSLNAKTYALPAGIDFDEIRAEHNIERVKTIELHNLSANAINYDIHFAAIKRVPGIEVWHPHHVHIPAKGKTQIQIRLRIYGDRLNEFENDKGINIFDGWLNFSQGSEPPLKVALQSVILPISNVTAYRSGNSQANIINTSPNAAYYSIYSTTQNIRNSFFDEDIEEIFSLNPIDFISDATEAAPAHIGISANEEQLDIGLVLKGGNYWHNPGVLALTLFIDYDNDNTVDAKAVVTDSFNFEKDTFELSKTIRNFKGDMEVFITDGRFQLDAAFASKAFDDLYREASDYIRNLINILPKIKGTDVTPEKMRNNYNDIIGDIILQFPSRPEKGSVAGEITDKLLDFSLRYIEARTAIIDEAEEYALNTRPLHSASARFNSQTMSVTIGGRYASKINENTVIGYHLRDLAKRETLARGAFKAGPNFKNSLPKNQKLAPRDSVRLQHQSPGRLMLLSPSQAPSRQGTYF